MDNISSALNLAISLHLMPVQSRKIKKMSLPNDIETLILIATGDQAELKKATSTTHHSEETIKQAAIFFIENILLASDADSYRILGVNPDVGNDKLRRNMALMTRYLHPDITGNDTSPLITRVTNAWNDLKTTKKRATYDQQYRTITRQNRTSSKPARTINNVKSSQKSKLRLKKRFSFRSYWKGIFLRKLTLLLLKISGRS